MPAGEDRATLDDITPETQIISSTVEFDAMIDDLVEGSEKFGQLQSRYEASQNELAQLRGAADAARAQLIKPYAWAVLWFLCAYCLGVLALLLLTGFFSPEERASSGYTPIFLLDKSVLVTLVGSTAVAAIGLVRTVVKGLFPSPKNTAPPTT